VQAVRALRQRTREAQTTTRAHDLVPDVPSPTRGQIATPSPTDLLGVQGIGAAGTIGPTPVVINETVEARRGLVVTTCACRPAR
jgi:hypothetical protein